MSMPETDFDDNPDIDDEPAQGESSVIRRLRDEQKKLATELKAAQEQAAKADALAQENAFYKADLPGDIPESRRKAILAVADDHSPEGYRKAAEELGFIAPAQPEVPDAELDAQDRIAQATTGGGSDVDPANYEAEVAAAANQGELEAIMRKHGRSFGVAD